MPANSEGNSKFYGSINERQNCGHDQDATGPSKNGTANDRFAGSATGKDSQSTSPDGSYILDTTLIDGDRTIVLENGSRPRANALDSFDAQASPAAKSPKPPPLPPKPKNLIANATKTGYFVSSKSLPKSSRAVPLSPTESSRKNIF